MGIDYDRLVFEGGFTDKLASVLTCYVCGDIMEDPVQLPVCEHAFCSRCIQRWVTIQETCPIDREKISTNQFKTLPRIIRNLLSCMKVKCEFSKQGCEEEVSMERLGIHQRKCEYNPSKPCLCASGCGLRIPRNQLDDHDCIRDLRKLADTQQGQILDLKIACQKMADQLHLAKSRISTPGASHTYMDSISSTSLDITLSVLDMLFKPNIPVFT